jgi:hypothetical protein
LTKATRVVADSATVVGLGAKVKVGLGVEG